MIKAKRNDISDSWYDLNYMPKIFCRFSPDRVHPTYVQRGMRKQQAAVLNCLPVNEWIMGKVQRGKYPHKSKKYQQYEFGYEEYIFPQYILFDFP